VPSDFDNVFLYESMVHKLHYSGDYVEIQLVKSQIDYIYPDPKYYQKSSRVRRSSEEKNATYIDKLEIKQSNIHFISSFKFRGREIKISQSKLYNINDCAFGEIFHIKDSDIGAIYSNGLNIFEGESLIENTVIHHLHREALFFVDENARLTLRNVKIHRCDYPCFKYSGNVTQQLKLHNVTLVDERITDYHLLQIHSFTPTSPIVFDCDFEDKKTCAFNRTSVVSTCYS